MLTSNHTSNVAPGESPLLFVGNGKGRPLTPWTVDAGIPQYGPRNELLRFLPDPGSCKNRGCTMPRESFIDKRAGGLFRWRTRDLCVRCNSLWAIHRMTMADLVRLWRGQGKRCFNCRKALPDPRGESRGGVADIDHDHSICPAERHSCGECRRGLACHGCNVGALSRRWQRRRVLQAA